MQILDVFVFIAEKRTVHFMLVSRQIAVPAPALFCEMRVTRERISELRETLCKGKCFLFLAPMSATK